MKDIKYTHLRMIASAVDGVFSMEMSVASGFADFSVTIAINQHDFDVIEKNEARTALLCAALHHPFQLKETALSVLEQRHYLNVILHGSISEVENFLTQKDHGSANGAISNYLQIVSGKDRSLMRKGRWLSE